MHELFGRVDRLVKGMAIRKLGCKLRDRGPSEARESDWPCAIIGIGANHRERGKASLFWRIPISETDLNTVPPHGLPETWSRLPPERSDDKIYKHLLFPDQNISNSPSTIHLVITSSLIQKPSKSLCLKDIIIPKKWPLQLPCHLRHHPQLLDLQPKKPLVQLTNFLNP